MREAQDRQKCYADKSRKELEFEVGDMVYLKMAMLRGPNRSLTETKLSLRFMGPFRIVERVGPVVYRLELPEVMHAFHKVFHVSMLRKCLHKDDEVLATIPTDLQPSMTLEARPVRVLERRVKELRRKKIPLMRVQWDCDGVLEETWEPVARMKARFRKWFDKQVEKWFEFGFKRSSEKRSWSVCRESVSIDTKGGCRSTPTFRRARITASYDWSVETGVVREGRRQVSIDTSGGCRSTPIVRSDSGLSCIGCLVLFLG
ncbi:uncharacterized protein LOC111829458 [Capsella rubella]|uniref:uncharacterized protein LOC111829458 n=1 Tax=Capsella rubella TaxID=81985 RepID=UPI000CD56F6E|nr:uncharacterized protein LOC111829458 [Capsella rubella]